MSRAGQQLALVAILITGAACGSMPSQSVAGTWRFTFGKSRVYEMSLTQTGKRISGSVCVYSLSAGFPPRVFEAGVTGDYPYLHFTDPLVAGCAYNLRFEDERDQIAGDCGTRSLVRFDRGGSGRCEVGGP